VDKVTSQGFDAAAKEKAESLVQHFRDYIEQHRSEIAALQILYSRPFKQRLTEEALKELEAKLKPEFGPDPASRVWEAFQKVEAASSRSAPTKRQDAASTLFHAFDRSEPVANLSGNLPHWRQDGTTYFVTFRTADSLPKEKLIQWQSERAEWLRAHPEPHTDADRHAYYQRFPERFQHWLDQDYGACVLARPELKQIVESALRHFDGERYRLGEFVVMPNHVHALVTPLNEHNLSDILHSWKSYTSSQINKQVGQSGSFWQKESFDHMVRSPASLEKFAEYIRENPRKVEAASSRSSSSPKRQDAASTLRRFTDLVSLVRFALQQEPVLEPFEEHVRQRFAAWVEEKRASGITFTADQLAGLEKMRDYISASGSVEREHFEAAGELGPIYRAFGERLWPLMEELNLTLAA
jgi:REP element-mobilizing transposase RayT